MVSTGPTIKTFAPPPSDNFIEAAASSDILVAVTAAAPTDGFSYSSDDERGSFWEEGGLAQERSIAA